jgi:hypothetical protein
MRVRHRYYLLFLCFIYNSNKTLLPIICTPLDHHRHHQPTTGYCWTWASLIARYLARLVATRIQLRHTTWFESVPPYVYRDAVSTPELVYPVGFTDTASPLPLPAS